MGKFTEAELQILVNACHGRETTLRPEDLARPAHQIILKVAQDLHLEGITPDLVTLSNKLKEMKLVEAAGGISYLSHIYDIGLPTKHIEPYEEIVRDAAMARGVVNYARGLLEAAQDGASGKDLVAKAQKEPMDLISGKQVGETAILQDVVFDVLEEIKDRKSSGGVTGVATPWRSLNRKTAGLHPGDLIMLAGRPSMGKTAMAVQIGDHVAETQGPVFVGSLEMSRSSLVERMLSARAKVDGELLRTGYFNDYQYEQLQTAAERLQDSHPILVNDSPRLSALDLRLLITKAHVKHGIEIAIIDYLSLFKDAGTTNRAREVGENTKIMRATARELGIPVLLLAQLNRSCEGREDKRPLLADLRESGEIEQDADVVLFLFREEYYCSDCHSHGKHCDKDHEGQAEVLIRKQRKGPIANITLDWHSKYTMFTELGEQI